MTPDSVLASLYACSGVAACAFYLPQLRALIARAEARRAMSLLTWGGWLGLGAVTVLYAILVVGETEMIVVTGLNWLLQAVVVALVAWQRLADRKAPPGPGPAP